MNKKLKNVKSVFTNVEYLVVNNNELTKTKGILYLINETFNLRLEFYIDNGTTLSFTIPISQLSPDQGIQISKTRPKIKLLLINKKTFIFSLRNLSEREKLKNSINELQDTFYKFKHLPELEKKRLEVISSNSKLNTLYNNLVKGEKVLSKEEFWNDRKYLYTLDEKNQETGLILGVKENIFAGEGGEGNKIRIKITPLVIKQIFSSYPGVKKTYQLLVPTKMSEEEFWEKFAKSAYFYRMRDNDKMKNDEIAKIFQSNREEENKNIEKLLNKCKVPQDINLNLNFDNKKRGYGVKTIENSLPKYYSDSELFNEQNMESFNVIKQLNNNEKSIQNFLNEDLSYQSSLENLVPSEKKYINLIVKKDRQTPFVRSKITKKEDLLNNKSIFVENFQEEIKNLQVLNEFDSIEKNQELFGSVSKDLLYQSKMAKLNIQNSVSDESSFPYKTLVYREFDVIYELLKHFWSAHPLMKKSKRLKSVQLKDKILRIVKALRKKHESLSKLKNERQYAKFQKTFEPMIKSIEKALKEFEKGNGNYRFKKQSTNVKMKKSTNFNQVETNNDVNNNTGKGKFGFSMNLSVPKINNVKGFSLNLPYTVSGNNNNNNNYDFQMKSNIEKITSNTVHPTIGEKRKYPSFTMSLNNSNKKRK